MRFFDLATVPSKDGKSAARQLRRARVRHGGDHERGLALHGGFIPYGGTFLTFSDYSRNAIRMAALMKLRVIHVFTHDSIGLGDDGRRTSPSSTRPACA